MIGPATVVEWAKLGEAAVASLVGAIGVTLAFSLLIRGAARAAEHRREGHAVASTAYGVLAVVAALVCIAAVVAALVVMTAKD